METVYIICNSKGPQKAFANINYAINSFLKEKENNELCLKIIPFFKKMEIKPIDRADIEYYSTDNEEPVGMVEKDMGYFYLISKIKNNDKYFISLLGGPSGQEYEYNHKQFKTKIPIPLSLDQCLSAIEIDLK